MRGTSCLSGIGIAWMAIVDDVMFLTIALGKWAEAVFENLNFNILIKQKQSVYL